MTDYYQQRLEEHTMNAAIVVGSIFLCIVILVIASL